MEMSSKEGSATMHANVNKSSIFSKLNGFFDSSKKNKPLKDDDQFFTADEKHHSSLDSNSLYSNLMEEYLPIKQEDQSDVSDGSTDICPGKYSDEMTDSTIISKRNGLQINAKPDIKKNLTSLQIDEMSKEFAALSPPPSSNRIRPAFTLDVSRSPKRKQIIVSPTRLPQHLMTSLPSPRSSTASSSAHSFLNPPASSRKNSKDESSWLDGPSRRGSDSSTESRRPRASSPLVTDAAVIVRTSQEYDFFDPPTPVSNSLLRIATRKAGHRISASTYSFTERKSLDSAFGRLGCNRMDSKLQILSPLVQETAEVWKSISMDRSISCPRSISIFGDNLPNYGLSEAVDSAILSMYMLKMNRRGKFHKRLIRFDGTLFICASSLSDYVGNSSVSEFDFLESPHSTVNKDLFQAIRDYYPAGNTVSSLARNLVSIGNNTTPDPESKLYHVPKWVIPVAEIIKFEHKPSTKIFTISTSEKSFTFQTYTDEELFYIKKLFSIIIPDSAENEAQAESLINEKKGKSAKFSAQQVIWKNALGKLIKKEAKLGPRVATIRIENTGVRVYRGLIIKPVPVELKESLPRKISNRSRFGKARSQ